MRLEVLTAHEAVVERNADEAVTLVHSYVSEDKRTTFCVYDAPDPEAIRRTAARNDSPVDRIIRVQILDPYFYTEVVVTTQVEKRESRYDAKLRGIEPKRTPEGARTRA
jgi:hypothetical protein